MKGTQEPETIRRKETELTASSRVYIKRNKIVVWLLHSSSGHEYAVTVFEGRAVGCRRTTGEACPSWHYRQRCHHASMATQLEAERDEKRTRENNFALSMGY